MKSPFSVSLKLSRSNYSLNMLAENLFNTVNWVIHNKMQLQWIHSKSMCSVQNPVHVITFLRPERKPMGMKIISRFYTRYGKCHTISSPGGFWGMHFIPFEACSLLELFSQCVIYFSASLHMEQGFSCTCMNDYAQGSLLFSFLLLLLLLFHSHAHLPVDGLTNAITLISHRHLETWEVYLKAFSNLELRKTSTS